MSLQRPRTPESLSISILYCSSNCSASSEPTYIKERPFKLVPMSFPEDQVVEFTQEKEKKREKGIFTNYAWP